MNIVLVGVLIASLGKIRVRPLSLATDPHLTPPAFFIYFSTKSQSWGITDKYITLANIKCFVWVKPIPSIIWSLPTKSVQTQAI